MLFALRQQYDVRLWVEASEVPVGVCITNANTYRHPIPSTMWHTQERLLGGCLYHHMGSFRTQKSTLQC